MPGSRPPTESIADVRESGLMQQIRKSQGSRKTVLYADGNRAWASEAKRLKFPLRSVTHQHKEFVRSHDAISGASSDLAGTQVLDRLWRTMKQFIPNSKEENANELS